VSAAGAAREADDGAEITVVGAEKFLPYYRPRLSHSLGGDLDPSSIAIHPGSWYDGEEIQLRTGREVVSVDAVRRRAVMDDGEELSWDALILATGARPFVPPVSGAGRPGVFTLRSLVDREAITAASRTAERAVIIGGGVLGLEAAWALTKAGLEVSVLERGPHLLGKMLDPDAAAFLHAIVERKGVRPVFKASTEAVVGTGSCPEDESEPVALVKLEDGRELPADLVLFSTGIRSETRLAEELGLKCGRGVPVDERMRTEISDVYACGDAAEFDGAVAGSWEIADRQGSVAGCNAAGGETAYASPALSRTLMVMGTQVFSVGDITGDEMFTITDCDRTGGIYRRIWLKSASISGAVLIGDVTGSGAIREAISSGVQLDPGTTRSVTSLLDAVW